eukprot:633221-Rhodomonas_salina.2
MTRWSRATHGIAGTQTPPTIPAMPNTHRSRVKDAPLQIKGYTPPFQCSLYQGCSCFRFDFAAAAGRSR